MHSNSKPIELEPSLIVVIPFASEAKIVCDISVTVFTTVATSVGRK